MQQITIIGCGLIGSSIARSIRLNQLAETIVCADMSEQVCKQAESLQLADWVTTDLGKAVAEADLCIVAVPVGATADVLKQIAKFLKPGSIVSDVGSVKSSVAKAFLESLPEGVHGVPAHPIAGTENSGPAAGFAELFHGRWCILTPNKSTDPTAVESVADFWKSCGSKVEIMTPQHHDLVLGITSHLPHLIAFTIVGTANELEEEMRSEVIKYSAGGFRDFTRIAASNPVMWRDIFLNNREAVLEVLQRFGEDLTALQKAIRKGDGDVLLDVFSETRLIRQAIIDSGQAE